MCVILCSGRPKAKAEAAQAAGALQDPSCLLLSRIGPRLVQLVALYCGSISLARTQHHCGLALGSKKSVDPRFLNQFLRMYMFYTFCLAHDDEAACMQPQARSR
eukprot:scaffold13985_cov86-Skeletonema_dohrnii-CCMP3373.AAC.5